MEDSLLTVSNGGGLLRASEQESLSERVDSSRGFINCSMVEILMHCEEFKIRGSKLHRTDRYNNTSQSKQGAEQEDLINTLPML